MSAQFRKLMPVSLVALIFAFRAPVSAAAENQPVVRFLSETGVVLPADWRPVPAVLTIFIVHGFQASGTDEPFLRQAAAFRHSFSTANIVIVDWGVLTPSSKAGNGAAKDTKDMWSQLFGAAQELHQKYYAAVEAVPEIGKKVAQWMKLKGIDPAETLICGHSLGAQIAGCAGRAAADLTNQMLQTILAADPAGPGFNHRPVGQRLSKTDAQTVIVIHTTELLGDKRPLGTQDFYVIWPKGFTPDILTAHSLARELLTDSLLPPELRSRDWSGVEYHAAPELENT